MHSALIIVASALLCWVLLRLLMPAAVYIHWVDKPDHRKRHDGEIPLVGGAGIVLTLGVAALGYSPWPAQAFGLALAVPLMLMVGAFDDVRPVRARYRFAAQLVAAFAIVFAGDVVVHQLGQCFVPVELGLGLLAVPFTLVSIAGLVNAYNMSDGLDGLCGGLVLTALAWFLAGAWLGGEPGLFAEVAPVLLPVIGAVLGFLALNARGFWRARAALFLGDGGSMALGLVVAWAAVVSTQPYGPSAISPAAAVWIVALPVADMFACMVRRMADGKTPMTADRHHVHHMLLAMGFSPNRTVQILVAVSAAFGAVGVLGHAAGVPEYLLFWALIMAFLGYLAFTMRFWRRHAAEEARAAADAAATAGPAPAPANGVAPVGGFPALRPLNRRRATESD